MGECVNISYQNTLKQYHNFVVRSIFSLAMRSLPSKDEFFKRLIADHTIYMENKERFEKQVRIFKILKSNSFKLIYFLFER